MSARALEATPGHDSRGILAASGSGKRWMRAVAATEQHRLRLARYDCSSGGWWRRAAVRQATSYWQAVAAGGERRAVGEQRAATAERVVTSGEQ